jgi:hypothetical protein
MNLSKAWGLAAAFAVAAAAQVPDCSVAPSYAQRGAARTFTTDTLYEYMNGNSEGYFAYGFVSMKGVTCVKGDDRLIIDISEMADPEMAYGMFTANRDPNRGVDSIGTAGQITPRKAVFVKGKYYVEVAAEPDKDHTETLRAVVRTLEKGTPGESTLPAILSWFPAAGMAAGFPRLVPQSVLGIRALRRGYVAQYDNGAKAFIVAEETAAAAAAVLEKLRARFEEPTPVKLGDNAFTATDRYQGRLCLFISGRYIAGLVGVPEGQSPQDLAAALATRLR